MEQLASDFVEHPSRRTMPDNTPVLNLVHQESHLSSGGVSVPQYDSAVLKVKPVSFSSCTYGEIVETEVTMDDNTKYDVLECMPYDLQSDTAIASTTAWWTHPDLEHNRKTIRGAMRLGYAVLMIGPPKGLRAKNVSLSKAAYDKHRVMDSRLPHMEGVNPRLAIIIGSSRAAMTGAGMTVPHYARGRHIPLIDINGACVSRPFNLDEWPAVVAQIVPEGKSTIGIGVQYARRGQLLQLAKSLPPKDRSHFFNALRIFPGLIGGEAGRLADTLDHNTALRLEEYTDDGWAQADEYEKKFASRSNVLVVKKPGTHIGGIAHPQTRRDINARLERLRDLRGIDGSFDSIDFAKDILPVESVALSSIRHYNKTR